jgi:uncharacterized protein (TIGR03066 family)
LLFRELAMKKNSDRWRDTLQQAVDREVRKVTKSPTSDEPQEALPPAQPKRRRSRLWLFLLVCLVGSYLASYVIFKYIAPTIPHELIGTWQVAEGPLKGATLEFRWYGTAIGIETDKQGKKTVKDSTVKVSEKNIYMTSVDETGNQENVVQTILKLTKDELIIRDEDRNTFVMTRVRN